MMAQCSTVFIQYTKKTPSKVILVEDFPGGDLWALTQRPYVRVNTHIQIIHSLARFLRTTRWFARCLCRIRSNKRAGIAASGADLARIAERRPGTRGFGRNIREVSVGSAEGRNRGRLCWRTAKKKEGKNSFAGREAGGKERKGERLSSGSAEGREDRHLGGKRWVAGGLHPRAPGQDVRREGLRGAVCRRNGWGEGGEKILSRE